MARIRSIKPEFWTDSKIVALTPYAQLLFIGIWNFADDYGCIEDDTTQLKLRILPAADIDADELVTELLEARLVVRMRNDQDERFLRVVNWDRHQKVANRSAPRFGDANTWSPDDASPRESSRGLANPNSQIKEGIKEGKGSRKGMDVSSRARARAATPIPNDWQPNDTHTTIAGEEGVNLHREAERFRDHAHAKDRRLKDWDAAFRNWLRSDYTTRNTPDQLSRRTREANAEDARLAQLAQQARATERSPPNPTHLRAVDQGERPP